MEVSSLANCDVYSFKSASSMVSLFGLSLWCGGSKASGSTCSDIIFFVLTLLVVWSSGFLCEYKFFSLSVFSVVGSKCPTYSPMLNVTCLLLEFDTRILTDVLPFMLWIPFTMFMLVSFPFVDSWLLMKHAVLSCDWVSFDSDWYNAIMFGRYLKHWFNNSYCCLLFAVSGVCEKSVILLYVAILLSVPSIW